MKKIAVILSLLFITSCSVNTSGNINIDSKDIRYFKDSRTGICFAIVASRASFSTDATGLGLTTVPCKEI